MRIGAISRDATEQNQFNLVHVNANKNAVDPMYLSIILSSLRKMSKMRRLQVTLLLLLPLCTIEGNDKPLQPCNSWDPMIYFKSLSWKYFKLLCLNYFKTYVGIGSGKVLELEIFQE